MISFFKKIRRQAIDNGNVKRIAFYALGEIFLVVVGILIAVNINNWNNERSRRQAIKISLNGLLSDLQQDAERFAFLYKEYDENVSRCDSLIVLLDLPESDARRERVFKYAFVRFFSLNPFSAAYEEMKNSGKLYLLPNAQLAREITNYYTSVDRNEQYIENGHEGIRYHMNQLALNDYWLAIRKKDGSTHTQWLADKNSDTHKSLEFLVYMAKGRFRSNRLKVEHLKKRVETLMIALQVEIAGL